MRADAYLPGERRRPARCDLLQGEEDAAYGGAESGRDAGGSAGSDQIARVLLVAKERTKVVDKGKLRAQRSPDPVEVGDTPANHCPQMNHRRLGAGGKPRAYREEAAGELDNQGPACKDLTLEGAVEEGDDLGQA